MATGLSNTEIAEKLVVSEATVKPTWAHPAQAFDLRNRVQAVIFAYDIGLVREQRVGRSAADSLLRRLLRLPLPPHLLVRG